MKIPLRLTAVFEESEEGGFIGYFEELPSVTTKGNTLEETKTNLADAYKCVADSTTIKH